MTEFWKDIEGYEGLYQISNMGRIKSLPKICGVRSSKEKIIRTFRNHSGYELATLCKDGNQKHFQVHRLVATTFIPNNDSKPQVDHINRIRNDNRVLNLRWVTNKENSRNSSTNNLVTYKGKTKSIVEWSEEYKINPITLQARIFRYGWPVERALTEIVSKSNGAKQTNLNRTKVGLNSDGRNQERRS